jgi:H2-forming N5,N10-methylenetetrahydromethanopterin dehydrogenase-like enzyme
LKSKKNLIISRSFYPINSPRSFRSTELAKELARNGHDIIVLTPKKEVHDSFEKEHNLIL